MNKPESFVLKFIGNLPKFLLFAITAVLGIRHLREPDLWWQLRTGEWILEHFSVPRTDVFSYTFSGTPWVNIKWGFEVLLAGISAALGAEWMPLLQIAANVLMLGLVIQIASEKYNTHKDPLLWNSASGFTGLLLLSGLAYRMNGRPEMVSHLLLLCMVLLHEREWRSPGKSIGLLVVLQLLWVNLHEAFAIGLAVSGIYWFAALVSNALKWTKVPVKKYSAVLVLQGLAVFVNPYGLEMLSKPAEIFGQLMSNKFTTELLGWQSAEFWKYEAYLFLSAWVALKLLLIRRWRQSGLKWKPFVLDWFRQTGPGYVLLLVVMSGLAFTAYRNLVFPLLLFAPLLLNEVYRLVSESKLRLHPTVLAAVVSVLLVVAYVSVVNGKYYELRGNRDRYGLGVWPLNNPVGAADFLEKKGLQQKRIFSDYLTSSYLLWRLQPEFKTFIDLRDLDVFPESFFGVFSEAVAYPEMFDSLDRQYGFDAVVLFRPQFGALHRHLYQNPNYSMAYADAVAVVYCKDSLIPKGQFTRQITASQGGLSVMWLNRLFNPFYKGLEPEPEQQQAAAMAYYLSVGDLAKAGEETAWGVRQFPKSAAVLDAGGQYFYQLGLQQSDSSRVDLILQAERYFEESMKADPGYVSAYLGKGAALMQRGSYAEAAAVLEKGIEQDDEQLQLYLFAAECYKVLANRQPQQTEFAKALLKAYQSADRLNPNNPVVELNLGFAYYRNGACDKAVPLFEKAIGFDGIPEADKQAAAQCMAQCRSRKE